jgi:hypothetical protein
MNSFAGDCERPGHAGDITKKEAEAGILPSHGMSDFGLDPLQVLFGNKPHRNFPRCPRCDRTRKASYNPASVC